MGYAFFLDFAPAWLQTILYSNSHPWPVHLWLVKSMNQGHMGTKEIFQQIWGTPQFCKKSLKCLNFPQSKIKIMNKCTYLASVAAIGSCGGTWRHLQQSPGAQWQGTLGTSQGPAVADTGRCSGPGCGSSSCQAQSGSQTLLLLRPDSKSECGPELSSWGGEIGFPPPKSFVAPLFFSTLVTPELS